MKYADFLSVPGRTRLHNLVGSLTQGCHTQWSNKLVTYWVNICINLSMAKETIVGNDHYYIQLTVTFLRQWPRKKARIKRSLWSPRRAPTLGSRYEQRLSVFVSILDFSSLYGTSVKSGGSNIAIGLFLWRTWSYWRAKVHGESQVAGWDRIHH